MFRKWNKYSFLVLAAGFFAVAAILENGLFEKNPEDRLIEDFRGTLHENEQELSFYLRESTYRFENDSSGEDFLNYVEESSQLFKDKGFGFLVYEAGELSFWSDRSISFYTREAFFPDQEGLIQLPNGYYIFKKLTHGDTHVYGLHLIKHCYNYENKYLENDFYKEYKLPAEFEIVKGKCDEAYAVFSNNGNYLFSIKPEGPFLCTTHQLYFPGLLYFIGLLILLYYFRREFIESKAPYWVRMVGLTIFLFLVYWLHLIFKIPKVFHHLEFFSPSVFALSSWLPSLGDYFLLALFFLFWIYNLAKHLNLNKLREGLHLPRQGIIFFLFVFAGSIYLLIHFYIQELIFNSTISFSLNRITGISVQSVWGIISVGMLLLAALYLTIKVVEETRHDLKFHELVVYVVMASIILAAVQIVFVGFIYYEALGLFIAASLLASLFSRKYLHNFALSYLIIFVSAASLYSLVVFFQTITKKQREEQKLMAVTLVAERDPTAEVLLAEIQDEISTDPVIPELLIEGEGMVDYLEQTYFSSYFRKYDVRFFVCDGTDSLFIEMENRAAPCFDFFENMIETQGVKIPGTGFYFMDNMNGRISYTGRLHYPLTSASSGVSIFVELNSDLLYEGIGFPELLIDKSMEKPELYKKFDYAKYYGGELTDKHGDYNYNFYINSYLTSDKEFTYKSWDGREHLIYHTREYNYVIVSRELITVVDYLISFPYLFVFYFVSVLILIFIVNPSVRKRAVKFDLKFRIQAAIISIVFVSLLLVAFATIFYNVKEYKEKHQNDLNEKMISIAEEIDMRLEDVDKLSAELIDWLQYELIKLSNIFRTDINIYGTDGQLIASSRSEIYNHGLVSRRMNAGAYHEIYQNFQVSYFQPEKIGGLSYLSGYRPIINDKGVYLGVINLPYFIKQDRYSQELSTIVMAFINLYVLLLLVSIFVAIFIANQITHPLVLIQENLKKMELGKRNEPISYTRDDEIGSLVKEYNKKVDELEVSAELLARSERESAWREMAKQIAHEIKNPLTPMKLNIQHLQRTRGKGKAYDEYIGRVTSTLIEQIDNLSEIATEFSNFAKTPVARKQVFKLAEQLRKVMDLFETHRGATLELHENGLDYLKVNADREQFSRAVINLVKNSIQSIPESRKGRIEISLSRREHVAIVAVSDNGEGISPAVRNKLFSPSFTTKSSGMGLGLSIVKSIVENFGGKIWFETEQGKGTTFYLEIPVHE